MPVKKSHPATGRYSPEGRRNRNSGRMTGLRKTADVFRIRRRKPCKQKRVKDFRR